MNVVPRPGSDWTLIVPLVEGGEDMARRARQHCPSIPVVVMTAYPTTGTQQEVRQMGTTTYVTKPFANAQFVEAVRRVLERHQNSCLQR